ncbi:MAG: fatty acid synthase subunit beta domain-containing protein [Microthrixaceae bacterium]
MAAIVAANPTMHPELAAEGVNASDWLDGGLRWSRGQRAARHLCLMGSMLSHMVATAALAEDGIATDAAGVRVTTGHSAGLFSAWVAARHGSNPDLADAARAVAGFAVIAAEMERQPNTIGDDRLGALLSGEDVGTGMLMVAGPSEPVLGELLADAKGETVQVSLQNCFDRWVLTGTPEELADLDDVLSEQSGVSTEFVCSSGIYHNPLMELHARRATERAHDLGLALVGELSTELLDPRDGTRHSGGDLTERVFASMAANTVRWADAISSIAFAGDVVLDVGPTTVTAALCRRTLRGSGAIVVAAGDPEQRRKLGSALDSPQPLVDFNDFAPRVAPAACGDDRATVRTRHTERSGRPAVVLAGMTPTTVDAEIVAAAANSGYVAELAGGGQVSTSILTERLTELSELLNPGHEVVFNALHLDPYLWNLHLGRDRLVQRARINGAPICGVTISAGVPESEEAADLLDELNELGIWLNAFKPGDVAGVRKVLAIAKQTDHDVWLHLEGGLAGGHHSWEDLETVLFATYADIRELDNVVLMVGGGIDSPQRSAELISGEWALRHGPRPMPVDGVLLGTVAMAVAESTASDSVKEALAAADGHDSAVKSGEFAGGVTSGLSGLGADIHYLDNRASRVAAVLDEVAGDDDAVAERHDEIASLLEGTAKPFFGDVTRRTWAQVANRFVELCALGGHGRYEDGRWLDSTHRAKFLSLLRRAEARCVAQDSGTFVSVFRSPADLDDPGKALEELIDRYPLANQAVLTPSDVAAFVEICDRPGKPVPFVPVIDSQVRRRYLSDSLWQSHSDLWQSDEVLVIPGPTSVSGIERANEPVADLLDRFNAEIVQSLGGPDLLVADDLLGESGAAVPTPPSSVESLLQCAAVSAGTAMVRSPLRSLGSPGAWTVTAEGDRSLAVLAVGSESATLEGPLDAEGIVTMTLRWPALSGVAGDGTMQMRFKIRVDHGVAVAILDGEFLADSQRGILDTLVTGAHQSCAARDSLLTPITGATPVPDSAMAFAWAPVFEALRGGDVSNGLLRLVHARHCVELTGGKHPLDVELSASPSGSDAATVTAELAGRARVGVGEQLTTVATAPGLRISDEFIIRDGAWGSSPAETPGSAESQSSGEAGSEEAQSDDVGESGDGWVDTPRSFLSRRVVATPRNPEVFAALSGDANPIHRSDLVARLAGLRGRIIHGMWTSAVAQDFVVSELLGGDLRRLTARDIRFVAMVEPGSSIVISASRTAVRDGSRRVELRIEQGGRVVALADAVLAAVRTAYVFPGQGIQAKGMGLDALERSAAARGIWERADRYCRDELGFSVLEVVRDNPTALQVGDEVHKHPAGVIHLTQFTQVAMATLAAAQVEELRDSGVLEPDAVIAGHSVGEYNALASAGGVLPLEAVLGIVWARGNAMHHLVPRAADGSSQYRLGVVRPHHGGIGEAEAADLVSAVATETGELCEIVNHNLRGRQYAVAGTVGSLHELERRLGPGRSAAKAPFLLVPGIDVPFHSRALVDGVAEFRAHLDSALPAEIDPADLVGRYVPNLHPEPFSLERSYVEAVAATCGDGGCAGILDDWDNMAARPGRLTRELLVELLAWQFASPVRWIETTDVLLAPRSKGGLGVEAVVEVGMGSSPTLTNLTKAAIAAESLHGIEVLHVDSDRVRVFEECEFAEPATSANDTAGSNDTDAGGDTDTTTGSGLGGDMDEDWDGDAPGPASHGPKSEGSGDAQSAAAAAAEAHAPSAVAAAEQGVSASPPAAPSQSRATSSPVEDRPVTASDAIAALLCHLTAVRPDQLGDDSIDDLVDGASSRRNQVLMDLGKEFGIGSVDGAHEMVRSVLCNELAPLVKGHKHPGAVLQTAVASALSSCLGPMGQGASFVPKHLGTEWALGDGWVQQVELELLLGTRDGQSRRGGDLRTIEGADAASLVDAALQSAASRLGLTLSRPVAEASGAVADAAELEALASRVGDAFQSAAAAAVGSLGGESVPTADTDNAAVEEDRERLSLLDLEHGTERAAEVAPCFDPDTVRCFDSATSWARADLDHLFHGLVSGSLDNGTVEQLVTHLRLFAGADNRFDATVQWYRTRADSARNLGASAAFESIAEGPTPDQRRAQGRFAGRTVLVSGASPESIGEATAAVLLGGSATVVLVSHSTGRDRRLAVRELFRRHAGPDARLFLMNANLASFTDIDRVVDWLCSGAAAERAHPGLPGVVLPFAASPVSGDVPDTGHRSEVEMRVLLLGVERLVGRLAEETGRAIGADRLTAVLPMSPNHGTFGGDGSYGNAKAGLEVLESRRLSEFERWGRHCRVVGAEIGWVRGTGLMAANDALAPLVEQQLGVRTYAPDEMGALIAELCAPEGAGGPPRRTEVDETSRSGVERIDLTGGLAEVAASGALSRLLRSGLSCASGLIGAERRAADEEMEPGVDLHALPTPVGSALAGADTTCDDSEQAAELRETYWPSQPAMDADDMVVICGTGEIGPWGSAATRMAAEHGDLGGNGIIELAIRCGLLRWEQSGASGSYVDVETDDEVEEHELIDRYREEVLARCGIREVTEKTFDQDIEVFLDRPVTVGIADRVAADAFAAATDGATVTADGDSWTVVLPTGAPIRMRRSADLPRGVTAAIPDGMTPQPFGVPVELAGSIDRMAAWNLAMTAEAFRDACTDPEEVLSEVHPSMLANTQGTGMGGLTSLRSLYVDPATGTDHPNDLLQESLGNVPAAHAMQSFVGGYGSMVHPVGACASAAVSLEVAADLVALGKADVVLAGGFDDLTREGIIGFADMAATADSEQMIAAGFEASELSRPGDSDRAGFVEGQGGAALLVCRGSVARRLGLPVRAVLGLARSHSDGVQTSIPAPGLGTLSIARGGKTSPLAEALAAHGLGADDISVVSKHDTSTRANDPNEAAIHERLQAELGRTPGNPLRVVSQKALTGHAKGGAAAWQVAGVCDIFETEVVPGNPNLDSPDPEVLDGPWLVADDRRLDLSSPPRAALVTSLGFGHVSAALLLVHPDAFSAAMDEGDRVEYLSTAKERITQRAHLRRWELHGGRTSFVRPEGRRLAGSDDDERRAAEMSALVDPDARIGPDGVFVEAAFAPSGTKGVESAVESSAETVGSRG